MTSKATILNHVNLEIGTSTHFPMLIKAMQSSDSAIAELGSGLFSTPLIHWFDFENKRLRITYESYPHYYQFAREFASDNHKIVFVSDWSTLKLEEHYSVVLIDHSIPRRKHTRGDDAIRFANIADYVILHDAGSNPDPKYGYENAYKHFRYRMDWDKEYPHTTVLSNFKTLLDL